AAHLSHGTGTDGRRGEPRRLQPHRRERGGSRRPGPDLEAAHAFAEAWSDREHRTRLDARRTECLDAHRQGLGGAECDRATARAIKAGSAGGRRPSLKRMGVPETMYSTLRFSES